MHSQSAVHANLLIPSFSVRLVLVIRRKHYALHVWSNLFLPSQETVHFVARCLIAFLIQVLVNQRLSVLVLSLLFL